MPTDHQQVGAEVAEVVETGAGAVLTTPIDTTEER